jgi:hypothetical protein
MIVALRITVAHQCVVEQERFWHGRLTGKAFLVAALRPRKDL